MKNLSKEARRSIIILIFSTFLICLGISIVIPVTPFIKREYGYSTTDMGIMTALFALAQFITSPIVGRISDKMGRKPMMALGLFFYMISELIFAMSNTLWLFNFSRIIGGISAGMFVPTSMAMAADMTSIKDRAKVIGWISASFSGGLILGPGIGGVLASFSYKTPFWAASALGLISTIFLIIFLPSKTPRPDGITEEESLESRGQKSSIMSILNRPMVIFFSMILVSAFGLQLFESIYSIYVNQVFNFSLNNIALVLVLNGVISLFLQVALFDFLVRKLTEIRLIRWCFLLGAVCVLWIVLAHSKVEVFIATLVIFSAFDLLRPAITTLLTKFGDDNQGLINGVNMSLTSVGNIIGPIIAGMLMDRNTHYPYIFAAIMLIISFLVTFTVNSVIKNSNQISK
ncbi:MFS transporter [Lactobacillus terrae]|uniref:MFS transporter n=1 Tax=Lactobacillus terrae TaxID=2269374 RepID=UPI003CCBA595